MTDDLITVTNYLKLYTDIFNNDELTAKEREKIRRQIFHWLKRSYKLLIKIGQTYLYEVKEKGE